MDTIPAKLWSEFVDIDALLKLGGAFLLALPIAYNREKAQRTAGIRTFPIVSITSCGFLMIGLRFLGPDSEANARLIQGLVGGLGFLGGGAILKTESSIRGMATAAAIWCAGAIGAACAYSQWEVALALMLTTLVSLQYGTEFKKSVIHNGNGEDDRPCGD